MLKICFLTLLGLGSGSVVIFSVVSSMGTESKSIVRDEELVDYRRTID
jgi:hypothetical protein